jgi:DNA-binding GntR family transcriptional regulator
MERLSSGDLVAAHIRRLVVEGAYRPGERVRQDEIATELGVSRIPVREAIIALEREGWVTVEPHRGAFVNGIDADYVRDHFELHAGILGVSARRVHERSDEADRAAVAEAAAAVAACEMTDVDAFNVAVYGWVDAMEAAAHAPRLSSMTRVMANIVPGNFFATVPDSVPVQRRAVAEITDAVVAGDAERAAAGYADLLRRHGALLIALLDSRGVFTGPAMPAASAVG